MKVLDSKNREIVAGSIVAIGPSSRWTGYQGLVVESNSDMEDDDCTVAVFLGYEVRYSEFNHDTELQRGKGIIPIGEWDRANLERCRLDDRAFLIATWRTCPRVVFFQSNELEVQNFWTVKTLLLRFFHRNHFESHNFLEGTSLIPTDHRCWVKGCSSPAEHTAVVNVYGSVLPFFACDDCHAKWNGTLRDEGPELNPKAI